eukprot:Sspe_Gene.103641::Locus_79475_Transcript_1_1_Confidence_1.000_Length_2558::g.103641::m.103641/K11836/USP5_13, UBP14; ubiquitin carboxyl-terminal hydrolase 5/13
MPVGEELLESIRRGMKNGVKVPSAHDRVYREECMTCFDTPYLDRGLYVSLATWQGLCAESVKKDAAKTGNTLYLYQRWTKVLKPEAEDLDKVTKLAIGKEGGFVADRYDTVKEHWLAVVQGEREDRVPFPCDDLPTLVSQAIEGIINNVGVNVQQEVAAWEEEVKDSKYAENLEQVPDPPKISADPKTWKCQESGMTENLWLNLSTGHIGSGRRNPDGTGGTGAALRHYEETGRKYPLVVKLGTITPDGADVYSYAPDEDNSVRDPKLAEHLAHFGIDIMLVKKTEKTTAELEVELNKSFGFAILENDKELEPVKGAGFKGLTNIGNSCYIASVLQALFSTPEVNKKYVCPAERILESSLANPANDLVAQMAKMGVALCTDRYTTPDGVSTEENPGYAICPYMFKSVAAANHPEFTTSQQQDASQYFHHLMDVLMRNEQRAGSRLNLPQTSSLFKFLKEERLQCGESKKVRYSSAQALSLDLPIPLSEAANKEAVDEYKEREAKKAKLDEKGEEEKPVVPSVPHTACLRKLFSEELISDWNSPVTNSKTFALKTTRFQTFPPYLVLNMSRIYLDGWEPKKMEVEVPMPDDLDLTAYKASGLQPGEEEMPAAAEAKPKSDEVEPSPEIVMQLVSMGFGENGCKKACIAVRNAGVEPAMEWVLAHMADPDFNDPPKAKASSAANFSDDDVQLLISFGFNAKQARAALKNTGGDKERAADWLFSRGPDFQVDDEEEEGAGEQKEDEADSGEGRYTLCAIISHIGKNTHSGHYVAHIRKEVNGETKWVYFNDEKVHLSKNPPHHLGYMYIYRRNDFKGW